VPFIDIEKLEYLIVDKRIKINLIYLNDDLDDVLLLETGEELQKKLNDQGKFSSVFTNEER
jgi:hypothetical protein